jgi:hypothetical protein
VGSLQLSLPFTGFLYQSVLEAAVFGYLDVCKPGEPQSFHLAFLRCAFFWCDFDIVFLTKRRASKKFTKSVSERDRDACSLVSKFIFRGIALRKACAQCQNPLSSGIQ